MLEPLDAAQRRTFDNGERVDTEDHGIARDGGRCIGHEVAHVETHLLDCAVGIVCLADDVTPARAESMMRHRRPQIVIAG